MYPELLPFLGGQSVPERSRNSVACLTADLKVIFVHGY